MILTKYIYIKIKWRQRRVTIICHKSNPALFFTLWLCVNYNYSNCNTNDSPELILLELKDSHLFEKQNNYKKTIIYTYKEEQTFTSIAVYAFLSQEERKESDQTVVISCAKKKKKT